MTTEKTYEPLPGWVFAQTEDGGVYHLGAFHKMDGGEVTYTSECAGLPDAFVPTDVKTRYEKLPGKDICEDCARSQQWLIER